MNNRTDEQIVKSGPFRVRLYAEKEKKLPTVIAGLFSLREKAPTKNDHNWVANLARNSAHLLKQKAHLASKRIKTFTLAKKFFHFRCCYFRVLLLLSNFKTSLVKYYDLR